MPPWCTCLFCIGWLGNVQRFITRAEPLYDSLNPLFCDVFAAVVVCARSLLLWSIKSHDVDLSVFCLLLYFWFKPRSHWKIPSEQLSSSTLEKDWTICPWKFPEFRPNFWSNGKRTLFRTKTSGQMFLSHVTDVKCYDIFKSLYHDTIGL